LNLKKGQKDIAIFENNDLIGFEEILRDFILVKDRENERNKNLKDGKGSDNESQKEE
jgi:hypothetical protein